MVKSILTKGPSIIYTTQIGWVEGIKKWFYVPVTLADKDDLIYPESVRSRFHIPTPHITDRTNRFEILYRVLEMLDVTDKKITLPLLSYTFLSLISSLINYRESEMPKFTISIVGKNKALSNIGFANLFCNIYDRKVNISSISSRLHSNSILEPKKMEKKASSIRDGIFIINAEKRPKMIKRALDLLEQASINNMILLLNESKLDKEFVLNLDITSLEINVPLLEKLRKEPNLLSTCIYHVTEHFRTIFNVYKTDSKKKIEAYFQKKYQKFRRDIEMCGLQQEDDKIHIYSCLLIGLDLLLSIGKNDVNIYDERVSNERIGNVMNEVLHLF